MKYFLDFEFNGFGGEVISMALVREDGESLSLVFGCQEPVEWVAQNVMPILRSGYVSHGPEDFPKINAPYAIAKFLREDLTPITIVADWPDDIRYFCELLIVAPGQMVSVPSLTFKMLRVDAYPTDVVGAIQHNAYWDAVALAKVCGFSVPIKSLDNLSNT